MPVVYNLGQHGAPSSAISLSSFSPFRSSSWSSSLSLLGLSSPWLCGAVLVVAALLYRYRGNRSRGVSMSQGETLRSTKSPTPSQRSSDDRLRPEKDTSSSSSTWSPTVATVIKHGNHASGSPSTITTTTTTSTPMRSSVFPYPNLPSPTLSPMSEANDDQDRDIVPALEMENRQTQPISPTFPTPTSTNTNTNNTTSSSTSTGASPSPLPTPPRRRSYTKTSIIPLSPTPAPPRAYTFPITADESEFRFGSGIVVNDEPSSVANANFNVNANPNANNAQQQLQQQQQQPLVMGIELAEEVIIAAEGWRRHTRVYGGSGVCRACEESEEQMRALGVRPVEMDA